VLLTNYTPKSRLCVHSTHIHKPLFPVIDSHNHIGDAFGSAQKRSTQEIIDILDKAHVQVYVDLDGGWGESILKFNLDHYKGIAPDRFIHFGGVDWSQWADKGEYFPDWASDRLREQVSWGAQGLKIWKKLGLDIQDPQGKTVSVDDVRLDPIWRTAADLGIPVLVHIADPVAFFDSLDENNERWEELTAHPDWHFPSPPYPPFIKILNTLDSLITRHPKTTFIGAHVGCYAENLSWVSDLLDRAPNFYIDISARISELGRQPYTARRFFMDYADRILFGTDMGPDIETYRIYYRFLETDDEYFSYSTGKIPGQGRWQIYGLHLPDEVLRKIYYKDAMKILGLKGGHP